MTEKVNPYIPDFRIPTSPAHQASWYSSDLKKVLALADKNPAESYQKLAARLEVNTPKNSAFTFDSDADFVAFKKLAADIIERIPPEVIASHNSLGISNAETDILNLFHQEFYASRRLKLPDLAKTNLIINAINYEKDTLVFDCWFYHAAAIARKDCKLTAALDGKNVSLKQNHVFSKTVYFGRTVAEKYSFQFKIPVKSLRENSRLEFYLSNNTNKLKLNIKFARPAARLGQKWPNAYWCYDGNHAILHGPDAIIFETIDIKRQELKLWKDFVKCGKKFTALKAIAFRLAYFTTRKRYQNKTIFVTFDKLYKAGDNGEYFYQYCKKKSAKNPSAPECFYILDKDSKDYARLKSDKNVLKFKSLKSRLVVLNSTAVFATHAGVNNFLGIHSKVESYLRDLMNYDVYCIQHGLTIQDIPALQNRLRDNTKLYFLASPFEAKNLKQPEYNYSPEQLVQAGLARFDGLKGKTKKQILLAPTWRSNMANDKTVAGSARPYLDDFKKTEYYQVFQSLLNNEKLKAAAEKYHYEIVYLLHPTLISQAEDFTTNSRNIKVKVPTGDDSYEKFLKESSLMVTDYSGVQYDFAYQKKPLIYFHPDSLPAHYDNSINYEKSGFGPIVKTEDALVDQLILAMKNNCKNPKKYESRAAKFFYFHDQNSCKRIYNAAIKFLKTKGKHV